MAMTDEANCEIHIQHTDGTEVVAKMHVTEWKVTPEIEQVRDGFWVVPKATGKFTVTLTGYRVSE